MCLAFIKTEEKNNSTKQQKIQWNFQGATQRTRNKRKKKITKQNTQRNMCNGFLFIIANKINFFSLTVYEGINHGY